MSDVPRTDPVPTAGASAARIERPTDDIERPAGAVTVPGSRRAAYTSLPTGPVGVGSGVTSVPGEHSAVRNSAWQPSTTEAITEPVDQTRLAPWALMSAIVALCASFFVGWGVPIAIVSVIAAIMSLRRPVESRAIANWALVLGLCATVYSLGWLVWAGMQFERLG